MVRLALFGIVGCALLAQNAPVVWSEAEQPIRDQIKTLRKVPDAQRGEVTKSLALRIRQLPNTANKLTLADGLADLSTEGDFGHATLQEVATTLYSALSERASVATS